MGPPLKGPWVESVPKSEVKDAYKDMGNDANIIVDHIDNASKWSVHAVNPTLESYISGQVVLVGDSVRGTTDCSLLPFIQLNYRPTLCSPTSGLASDKDLKMSTFSAAY